MVQPLAQRHLRALPQTQRRDFHILSSRSPLHPRPSTASFTLIELLVVVAIILILVGLLMTGVQSALKRGDIHKARIAVQGIAMAFRMYEVDYNQYPWATPVDGRPLTNEFTQMVLGDNTKGRVYMEFNPKEMKYAAGDTNYLKGFRLGTYADPWGNPYRVIFGDVTSGTVINPFKTTTTLIAPFVVWSAGPDGVWSNDTTNGENNPVNKDNITSY